MTTNKRIHNLETATGGDVNDVTALKLLGHCPSCAAELRIGFAKHPHTGQMTKALLHAVPFCTYFVETDPAEVERDVECKRKKHD